MSTALVRDFPPTAHENLLDELEHIGKRYAALWSDYGAGCLLDNQRKAFLSTIAARVRVDAAERGEKVTEKYIEEEAHAHPDYIAWLTEQEVGRMAFMLTELELDRCKRRIDALVRGVAA